jgi:hypothetical protein
MGFVDVLAQVTRETTIGFVMEPFQLTRAASGGRRGFADEWGDVSQMMRTAKFLVMLAGTIGAK